MRPPRRAPGPAAARRAVRRRLRDHGLGPSPGAGQAKPRGFQKIEGGVERPARAAAMRCAFRHAPGEALARRSSPPWAISRRRRCRTARRDGPRWAQFPGGEGRERRAFGMDDRGQDWGMRPMRADGGDPAFPLFIAAGQQAAEPLEETHERRVDFRDHRRPRQGDRRNSGWLDPEIRLRAGASSSSTADGAEQRRQYRARRRTTPSSSRPTIWMKMFKRRVGPTIAFIRGKMKVLGAYGGRHEASGRSPEGGPPHGRRVARLAAGRDPERPPGGVLHRLAAADGVKLRAAVTGVAGRDAAGWMVVYQGAEFIEKYFRVHRRGSGAAMASSVSTGAWRGLSQPPPPTGSRGMSGASPISISTSTR